VNEGHAVSSAPRYRPDLLEPKAPHDSCTFDVLCRRYNFMRTGDRRAVLTRVVLAELAGRARPVRVLDIGCGSGIGRSSDFVWAIREHVDELWGVEPDPKVRIEAGLFDHVERSVLEGAALPNDAFDVALAFMVMEHVADPAAFCAVLARTLKPGGAFFFVTPNGRHYFTRLAKLAHRIRIDELGVRLVRGRQLVEKYHYPLAYRFNVPGQVEAAIAGLPFEAPSYVYLEQIGPRGYFPGPLRPVFWLGTLKRRMWKDPGVLLDFMGRIRRLPR
jgi:SAM-dependent methyltransferase